MTDAPVYDPIPDYEMAAHGDPDACLRLSMFARQSVQDESDDPLTASMEGATLARLAAIRGNMLAAVLMAQHLLTVAEIYEAAGDSGHAECFCAESIAILELSEGHAPAGWTSENWSAHLIGLVANTASRAEPAFMALAKHYRTIWAPFLAPSLVPTGDKTQ